MPTYDTDKLRNISMVDYLSKRGLQPKRTTGKTAMYLSPFTKETKPSFVIDLSKNIFSDFSANLGGDIITFVKEYDNCTFLEACKSLSEGVYGAIEEYTPPNVQGESGVKIHSIESITDESLLKYFIEDRKINKDVLLKYTNEVKFSFPFSEKDPNKVYVAVGFPNSMGGYDLRNSWMKVATSPKVFSKIKGVGNNPNVINLFEGFTSMMSALTYWGATEFKNDTYCLNGVGQINVLKPMIEGKVINFFGDNDAAGDRLLEELSDWEVVDYRYIYHGLNDFNDFLKSF